MKSFIKTLPPARLLIDIRDRVADIQDRIDRLPSPSAIEDSRPAPRDIYEGHPDQAFGPTTYSQSGEDLIVVNLMSLLGIDRPSYLDIGANHPWHCSNTAMFYKRGSTGIAVDADPDVSALFRAERPNDRVLNVGVGPSPGTMDFLRVGTMSGRNTFVDNMVDQLAEVMPDARIQDRISISITTINAIVDTYCDGSFPDFLTIDIEGLDEESLRATDFSRSSPKVLCVESRNGRGDDTSAIVSAVAREKGFVPLVRTWSNAIFLSQEAHEILRF